MKKGIFSLLLIAVMLFGMLAMTGCNGKKASTKNIFEVPEGGFDPNQEVTISKLLEK